MSYSRSNSSSSYYKTDPAELSSDKNIYSDRKHSEMSRDKEYSRHSRDSRDLHERSRSRDRSDRYHSSSSRYSSNDRERYRDDYSRDYKYSSSRRSRSRSRSPRRSPRDRRNDFSAEKSLRDRPSYNERENKPIIQEPPVSLINSDYSRPLSSSYVGSMAGLSRFPPPPRSPAYVPSSLPYSSSYSRFPPSAPTSIPLKYTQTGAAAHAPYNGGYNPTVSAPPAPAPPAPAPPYINRTNYNSRAPSATYAPYSTPYGRTDNFASFSNLHHQDWSSINLIPFEKNFYREHPCVKARSESEVKLYREKHSMTIYGSNIPKPVETFEEGCFPEYISKMLSNQGFAHPTAIQAQVMI